jgi:hypothetical protein
VTDEKTGFSGVETFREQKIALIPAAAGSFDSEAMEIAWWNTRSDRMEIARLPGITIKALPSPQDTSAIAKTELPPTDEPLEGLAEPLGPRTTVTVDKKVVDDIWFWISMFLAVGWASTGVLIAKKASSSRNDQKQQEPLSAAVDRNAVKALKKACLSGTPREAMDALLAWSASNWPESSPKNLSTLAAVCGGEFANEIRALNDSLYSREKKDWNGAGFWNAFSAYTEHLAKLKPERHRADLEPLFKI